MKNLILSLTLFAALFAGSAANAYNSAESYDPNVCVPDKSAGDPSTGYTSQCTIDQEFKSVTKATAANYSDQIPAGSALYYSQGGSGSADLLGASIVSIEGGSLAGNDTKSNGLFACILPATAYTDVGSGSTTKYAGIATGFTAAFRCITRGYATANTDRTQAIGVGDSLCIGNAASTYGYLVQCASGASSRIRAYQASTSSNGAHIALPVVIESR